MTFGEWFELHYTEKFDEKNPIHFKLREAWDAGYDEGYSEGYEEAIEFASED